MQLLTCVYERMDTIMGGARQWLNTMTLKNLIYL